ncbi:hypothetical protein TNCT_715391 [Trichonephila clavata]|uniref:Uncharacterized protein n=1 Tax=Trichonephila clavata TaxID=2740835 RepID=A0A8X6L9B6_TRICU|nr:hypothetical protein TNCT_715391 [Trichonephila clavata]
MEGEPKTQQKGQKAGQKSPSKGNLGLKRDFQAKGKKSLKQNIKGQKRGKKGDKAYKKSHARGNVGLETREGKRAVGGRLSTRGRGKRDIQNEPWDLKHNGRGGGCYKKSRGREMLNAG